jgi:hypothetical protein
VAVSHHRDSVRFRPTSRVDRRTYRPDRRLSLVSRSCRMDRVQGSPRSTTLRRWAAEGPRICKYYRHQEASVRRARAFK